MITKADAMSLKHGTNLYHITRLDSKGEPIKCRVNGKCKTWKTRPRSFRLPVMYGLRSGFYIDQDNAHEWERKED